MKILFISSSFPDTRGGIGDYTYRLIEHLYNNDNEAHVITSQDPRIITKSPFCYIYPVVRSWTMRDYPAVSGIIKMVRPDIIHIQHDTAPYKNKKLLLNMLPALLRISYGGAKIITTIHEFREHRLRWKIRVLPMMIFSDRCILVDRWDMETVKRQFFFIPQDRAVYIPIASNIIPSKEKSIMPKSEIRADLGLGEKDIILIYFGLISPHKGVDALLDVFEMLSPSPHNVKLVVISDIFSNGCKKNMYQEAVVARIRADKFKERILTFESQEDNRLSLYLLSADIAVFPFTNGVSFQRGTFLACLSHGLPVLSTVNKRSYPHDIINGKDVILVEPGNSELLYKELVRLINEKKTREEIGKNAMKFYNDHFSWKRISEETGALYSEVLR